MVYICAYIPLRFKHAVLDTYLNYLVLDVNQIEEGVVALHLPIGPLFIHSYFHSFFYSLFYSFFYSFAHSFFYSFFYSFYSFAHSFFHSFFYSFFYSFIYLLIHSFPFIFISGHYCEFAVVNPIPCPRGTYMPWGVTPASAVGVEAGTGSEDFIGAGKIITCQVRVSPVR